VNTYRIDFDARNGGVRETLEIRFEHDYHVRQYRYEVKSRRVKNPNKVIEKQDWIAKKGYSGR